MSQQPSIEGTIFEAGDPEKARQPRSALRLLLLLGEHLVSDCFRFLQDLVGRCQAGKGLLDTAIHGVEHSLEACDELPRVGVLGARDEGL